MKENKYSTSNKNLPLIYWWHHYFVTDTTHTTKISSLLAYYCYMKGSSTTSTSHSNKRCTQTSAMANEMLHINLYQYTVNETYNNLQFINHRSVD